MIYGGKEKWQGIGSPVTQICILSEEKPSWSVDGRPMERTDKHPELATEDYNNGGELLSTTIKRARDGDKVIVNLQDFINSSLKNDYPTNLAWQRRKANRASSELDTYGRGTTYGPHASPCSASPLHSGRPDSVHVQHRHRWTACTFNTGIAGVLLLLDANVLSSPNRTSAPTPLLILISER
ncbi:hypothetical protein NL676_037709 [Syzygium grande]|nr:hypothetical protein NL676_037709 [Syzygium grande]